jgi:hypothetical protein
MATLGYRKYGSPLYGSAWVTASTVVLAGGGGDMACGLANKCAPHGPAATDRLSRIAGSEGARVAGIP